MQNKLKEIRKEKGLTQVQLATNSGVSRMTIIGLESGRATVTKTNTLLKLAEALGVTVSQIFF